MIVLWIIAIVLILILAWGIYGWYWWKREWGSYAEEFNPIQEDDGKQDVWSVDGGWTRK